jgi:hypothetical protein
MTLIEEEQEQQEIYKYNNRKIGIVGIKYKSSLISILD